MMNKPGFFVFLIFLFLFPVFLPSQSPNTGELDLLEQEYRKESLKKMALQEIANGEYESALSHLDAAIALAPDEEELRDLRKSVLDLIALEGEAVDEETDSDNPDFSQFLESSEENEVISPDFARELLSDAQRENPKQYRNAFLMTTGSAYGQTQAISLDEDDEIVIQNDDDFPTHPFYRFSLDSQYFFTENDRRFGFGARYKGAFANIDDTDMLEHQLDVTFHIRGFFAETVSSRLILGARAGFGFFILKEANELGGVTLENINTAVVGVYFEDALFRYLFKKSAFFERFIIDLNFDFFFLTSYDNVAMSQYSLGGAYKFNEHWSIGIFNEIFNSSSDIQRTSSWEAGLRLRYML